MEDVQKKLLAKLKRARMEQRGKFTNFLYIVSIVVVVVSIFYFVASKGLATFSKDKIDVFDFLFGTSWSPSDTSADGKPMVRALPVIAGSFIITFLSVIVAIPFAIGAAVLMTEILPKKGAKFLQPVIELLVGVPSVVYRFIGLSVIAPFIRSIFGGTGFGTLAGTLVLFVIILPTVTTMTVDTLKAVFRRYYEASPALGATCQQTVYKAVSWAAVPGILTVVVFGMARAFDETLAIQVIIGNAAVMPISSTTSASILTNILTMGIGGTIMGAVENNALWSLALTLLLMSLLLNIVTQVINKRGALK